MFDVEVVNQITVALIDFSFEMYVVLQLQLVKFKKINK